MVDELIHEIIVCLENGCYMAALTTALTLPDICGKAKYPNEKSTKQRYIKWSNEHIKQSGLFADKCSAKPYLSGELLYLLRCSVLHEGNPGVDKEESYIDYFELIWREKEGSSSTIINKVEVSNDKESNKSDKYIKYSINLRYLCGLICQATENYYEKNKELFDFFNYNLVQVDFHVRENFRTGGEK